MDRSSASHTLKQCWLICAFPQADHDCISNWFYLFLFLYPALHSRENILRRNSYFQLVENNLSFYDPPPPHTQQIQTAMTINYSHVFLIKLDCVYGDTVVLWQRLIKDYRCSEQSLDCVCVNLVPQQQY